MSEQPKTIGEGFELLPPQRKEDRPTLVISKRFSGRIKPEERAQTSREMWASRKRNGWFGWN